MTDPEYNVMTQVKERLSEKLDPKEEHLDMETRELRFVGVDEDVYEEHASLVEDEPGVDPTVTIRNGSVEIIIQF